MKRQRKPSDDTVNMWWYGLTTQQKLYAIYFLLSFLLLLGVAEAESLWALFAAVLNFGNSARLIKRVPTDKLED